MAKTETKFALLKPNRLLAHKLDSLQSEPASGKLKFREWKQHMQAVAQAPHINVLWLESFGAVLLVCLTYLMEEFRQVLEH